jgi:glucose-6-phosphate isomerase
MAYLAGHTMGDLIHLEQQATAAALTRNQRSNCSIHIPAVTPENIGALIYLFEVQTLFAGGLFNVNPLDQPGVEEGKQFTYALMGRQGYADKAKEYTSLRARLKPRVLACD